MSRRGAFHGIRRFLSPVRRNAAAIARDVDDEVAFHLAMRVDALVATGMSRADAVREARAAFGDVEATTRTLGVNERRHERVRARWRWVEEWRRDGALVVRQLRRSPVFAVLVIATLGLGIGATTAIFSAVRAILLAPLPFHEPARLVRVARETPSGPRLSSSGGDFRKFQRTSKTLSGLTSYHEGTGNLVGFGAPQRVRIARVSANFFDVLGVRPLMGRVFTGVEDSYKAAAVGMLSEGAWQRLFGGDRDVLNRTLRLDGQSVRVVGVISARTGWPAGVELWLPAQYDPELVSDRNRGASFLRLIGRLAPGVSLEQANAEFAAMSRSISERFPEARAGTVSSLAGLSESLVGDVRRPLWVLLGAVVLVLLVACTNVAALLLGRMMARENELTIRAALGAGRGRLMRQLLTESTTLGVLGAVVGVVLAVGLVRMLVALAPEIPRIGEVRVNAPVLLFSIVVGIVTGLVFGVVPAWQASKRDLQTQLRGAGRGLAGTRQAGRVRGALVVAQFALAIVLLTGAGLLLRTFAGMRAVDPGFATTNVTMFTVTLPQDGSFDATYGGIAGQRQFLREAIGRLRALPGVEIVGASSSVPLSGSNFGVGFTVDGQPKPPPGREPDAQLRVVTPEYFSAMGIALVGGRAMSAQDHDGAPMVMLVSEGLATRYFPGGDVLGKRLTFGWSRDRKVLAAEIVGVVRDVKQGSLTAEAAPFAYVAADQWPVDEYTFVLRSPLPAATLGTTATTALNAIDPELPIYDVRRSDALVRDALSTTRFYLVLLAIFAAVALLLASGGIYGVVSFGVQQRTREIGIRIALGASTGGVQAMVVRDGLRLVVLGLAFGVVGAISVTGLLRGVLFGVEPTDPLTLASVAVILTVAAIVACLVPARRAARIDPQSAIRVD